MHEVLLAAGGSRANTLDAATGRSVGFVATMRPGLGTDTHTSTMTWRPDGWLGSETADADPAVSYGYDPAGQLTRGVLYAGVRGWTSIERGF